MTKVLAVFLTITVFLTGCNLEEFEAVKDNTSGEKIWVFTQINVPMQDDKFEDYYYYGKISKALYERIKSNNINQGFILLDDVKYWGSDDLVHEYADGENEGELVFRIENIKKIKLVNKAPIAEKGTEQFDEKAANENSSVN